MQTSGLQGFSPLIDLNAANSKQNRQIYKVNISILSDLQHEIKGFRKNSVSKYEFSVKINLKQPITL